MRFLLVMLAVAASLAPLVACEATKSGEKDASPQDSTQGLAPATLRAEGNRPESDPPSLARPPGSDALRASGSPTSEALTHPSEATDTLPVQVKAEGRNGVAAKAQHSPTSIQENAVDEGNGEPMDDVDDEELPAGDKSGVDQAAAVDDEPEVTGIKLQE